MGEARGGCYRNLALLTAVSKLSDSAGNMAPVSPPELTMAMERALIRSVPFPDFPEHEAAVAKDGPPHGGVPAENPRHEPPQDPPSRTPYEVVAESGLMRLRRYLPDGAPATAPAVLLVYSLFKRPYVLDLLPERSVVRNLLGQGFTVYLTDWQSPKPEHADRGFDEYVNGDLACAVNHVRLQEGTDRVALVGSCFGGLLALLYAALHPADVERVVPIAVPVEMQPPFSPQIVEYVALLFGNVPGWWIRTWLNASVPPPAQLSRYVAGELGEPGLLDTAAGARFVRALQPWLDSDVPLAGRLFCEVLRDAYWHRQLAEGRLVVGGRQASLANVHCPVLNVSGERDRLVPPASTRSLVDRVGSRDARNLTVDASHLGLMLSAEAHAELWPRVGSWLRSGVLPASA
jgi:polyhydroxyalkanoate synthase